MALGKTTIAALGGCAGEQYLVPAGTVVASNTGKGGGWYVLEESDVRDCGVNDHDAAHYHLWVKDFVVEVEGESE